MNLENTLKREQQSMTCQTEQLGLAMLTRELNPGTIYRVKGDDTSWKYALVLKQINDKKEIIVWVWDCRIQKAKKHKLAWFFTSTIQSMIDTRNRISSGGTK